MDAAACSGGVRFVDDHRFHFFVVIQHHHLFVVGPAHVHVGKLFC